VKEPYQGTEQVHIANGSGMRIYHIGQALLPTSSSRPFHLRNIMHVPDVTKNILSVHKFTHDNNVFIEFHPSHLFIKDLDLREVLLRGRYHGGLYSLNEPPIKQAFISLHASSTQWHALSQIFQHILRSHELPSILNKTSVVCDACQHG
jgi:hypothetical protein